MVAFNDLILFSKIYASTEFESILRDFFGFLGRLGSFEFFSTSVSYKDSIIEFIAELKGRQEEMKSSESNIKFMLLIEKPFSISNEEIALNEVSSRL